MSKKQTMDCEAAQRVIALAAFPPAESGTASPDQPATPLGRMLGGAAFLDGETSPEELRALEEHLLGCRACQAELAATAAFFRALSQGREAEPTPNLLARARVRLDAALDGDGRRSGLMRLVHGLGWNAGRLRAAPGLAAAILLLGVGGGFWGGFRAGHTARMAEQGEIVLDPAEHPHAQVVADVSRIVREPGSDRVEIHYDLLEPQAMAGTLDDPSIRRLLVFGLENGADPSVRSDSVDLLTTACRAPGRTCEAQPVRAALLHSLQTDTDPRVRVAAMDWLAPYVGEDLEVRDAVLHAVVADRNAEVRMEGIRLLSPLGVDSSVRRALHTIAAEDGDPTIRSASEQVLAGVPQVQ